VFSELYCEIVHDGYAPQLLFFRITYELDTSPMKHFVKSVAPFTEADEMEF